VVAVAAQPGERLLEVFLLIAPERIQSMPLLDLKTERQSRHEDGEQEPPLAVGRGP